MAPGSIITATITTIIMIRRALRRALIRSTITMIRPSTTIIMIRHPLGAGTWAAITGAGVLMAAADTGIIKPPSKICAAAGKRLSGALIVPG